MHRYYMQRALSVASAAINITSPNPRVGCVIVHQEEVIAKGFTQLAGGDHAEIVALQQAKEAGFESLKGMKVYVTLEPCAHQGRTAPCVDALIAAQPDLVVIAMLDPNPEVSGKGVAALREAGIAVEFTDDEMLEEVLALNVGFVSRMLRGTPWLWLKIASSLDGRTALNDGVSKWITGTGSRADGQLYRARSCMVLTGINTVLDDDPLLNVRCIDTPRQPIRGILDSRLRTPYKSRIFDGKPVWIFTAVPEGDIDDEHRQLFAEKNARVISLAADENGQVDLNNLMRWLGANEINEVHVEAGATLNGSLMKAGYVDAVLSYVAPMLIGEGRPMVELGDSIASLDMAPRFELLNSCIIEKDVRLFMRKAMNWRQLHGKLQQLQHKHSETPS